MQRVALVKKYVYKFRSTFTESTRPVPGGTNRQSTSQTFSGQLMRLTRQLFKPRRTDLRRASTFDRSHATFCLLALGSKIFVYAWYPIVCFLVIVSLSLEIHPIADAVWFPKIFVKHKQHKPYLINCQTMNNLRSLIYKKLEMSRILLVHFAIGWPFKDMAFNIFQCHEK